MHKYATRACRNPFVPGEIPEPEVRLPHFRARGAQLWREGTGTGALETKQNENTTLAESVQTSLNHCFGLLSSVVRVKLVASRVLCDRRVCTYIICMYYTFTLSRMCVRIIHMCTCSWMDIVSRICSNSVNNKDFL